MPAGSRGPGYSAAPRRAGTSRRPGAHLASSTGSRLCHLHRGPAHVHSCDTPASRRVLENILLNFPAAGGQEGRKGRTCARRPLLSERGGGCSPARRSAWKRGDAGGCSEGPSSRRRRGALSWTPRLRRETARRTCARMSGGNGDGPSKKRQSGGAAVARLAGETSDNMKKPNDGNVASEFASKSEPASIPHRFSSGGMESTPERPRLASLQLVLHRL